MLKIRENCKYALIAPTSMGVRITPAGRAPVHTSSVFEMQATSAESNVLSIPAALGLPCKVLTAFVKGSPIASFIKSSLRARPIDFEAKEVDQGGPWGYRHQFNIADTGCGARGPRVHNDRAGEVGRTLRAEDFDLERIFGEEGAAVLHMSGLIASLSDTTADLCVKLARAAKKYGTLISFDMNYRASFWKGREESLRAAFREIASLADILIGNEEDFQLCLGIRGPEAGGKELAEKIGSFKEMIGRVHEAYPGCSLFATTLREVISADRHLWGAILLAEGQWQVAEPREIGVYDRIGGGDGFVGGLLYSLLKGFSYPRALDFARASGALTATLATDYALPADEEQIMSIVQGNARVRR